MQGYSTGWKFNGWFDGTAPSALSGDGVFTNAANNVSVSEPNASWQGGFQTETAATSAIFVHGYNAVRLRFPMSTLDGLGGVLTYPVTWNVYLIDSDVEPDQTATMWQSSRYCSVLTSWPATVSAPTSTSTTTTTFFGVYGKSWIRLANAVRIVQGSGTISDLREIAPTNPTSANPAYGYLGNTFAGAMGSYSSLQPHNIPTGGTTLADINSDVSICPTYSPALGTGNTTMAGEMYINNLGGAQYLLCVPIAGWGYVPNNTKYGVPSATITGRTKSVGVMYNLIQ